MKQKGEENQPPKMNLTPKAKQNPTFPIEQKFGQDSLSIMTENRITIC